MKRVGKHYWSNKNKTCTKLGFFRNSSIKQNNIIDNNQQKDLGLLLRKVHKAKVY